MICFFPTAYKDEVLYSILCRYHIRSGNISYVDTIKDLYGNGYIKSIIDLPTNNKILLSNLPYKKELSEFIDKFTLVNYYTSFLNKDTKKKIIELLVESKGNGIHAKVGAAQRVTKYDGYIKICPECYNEEVQELGEAYLHRLNQVPGVFMCLEHKVPLYRSTEPFTLYNNKFVELSNLKIIKLEDYEIIKKNIDKFIDIAEDVEFLLNNKIENKPIDWFGSQYKNRLKQLNLCTPKGIVNISQVKSKFNEFYGEEFLSLFNLDVFSEHGDNWIKYLIRNKKFVLNPIKHVLFARFLGIEISQLFSKEIEYKPFGEGNWVCKNKICNNYDKEVIDQVAISYNSHKKRPVGRFRCEDCGYIYSRIGSDVVSDDKYNIGKTIEMGWLWEEKLKTLLKMNYSLNKIEKELMTSQKTIKKYAIELGYIDYVRNRTMSRIKIECGKSADKRKELKQSKKINEYREVWIELVNSNPNTTITKLRENNIKIYDYLYRVDKLWLYDNRPEKTKRVNKMEVVNWHEKDIQVLNNIKAKLEELDINYNKPKEISLTYIGKIINNKTFILNNINRLPLSKAYIEHSISMYKKSN